MSAPTYTQTVQWIRRGTDPSGSAREGTRATDQAPQDVDAVYAPGGSSETTAGGDTVVSQPTLYHVDPSLPISALDVMVVNGDRYEVDGRPQVYPPNPFDGTQVGQVVALKRETG